MHFENYPSIYPQPFRTVISQREIAVRHRTKIHCGIVVLWYCGIIQRLLQFVGFPRVARPSSATTSLHSNPAPNLPLLISDKLRYL
jgi:hypothetical protein